MSFALSRTNDEAAVLTALGAGVTLYLDGVPVVRDFAFAVLAGLGVLGYTGYKSASVQAVA